ncbi:MAG: alkaline phosphatase D family protein [Phycisphaerae bacterium]
MAALLLCIAAPAALAQTKIVAGPMIGHVSDTTARLWMQLNTSEVITVRVFDVIRNQPMGSVRVDVEGPAPFIFDSPLSGLKPNHNYRIEVLFDNQPVELPEPQPVLRTAPPPGEATTFTVGFGSCMSPAAVDAGEGGGGGKMPIFKPLDLIKPRAFFFLGNTGYLPVDFNQWPPKKRQAMRMLTDFHHHVRAAPDLQHLLRGSAIYGIWDEHDFGSANAAGGLGADGTAGGGFVFTKESRAAFIRYWPNPDYGTPDAPGIFYSVTLGDVDFFVLDNRTFRTPPMSSTVPGGTLPAEPSPATTGPAGGTPVMLGAGQIAWLKDGLTKSNATFKIIACGCPMLPTYRPDHTWAAYPEERAVFFTWLKGSHIPGVVLISGGGGSEHLGSELSVLTPPDKAITEYPIYDLTCAPLAVPAAVLANIEPAAGAADNPLREGPAVRGTNVFGTLDFGGPKSKRHMTLRVRDAEGKTRLEKVLFADELKGE